jgi:signal transduction histidine kinase
VNDILDLSKIDAGEARVAHADAWTGPPVGAALDLVRPQASAKGVRLVDDRPDDEGVPYVATTTACGRSCSTSCRTR